MCIIVLLKDETTANAALSALEDKYKETSYQLINTPETIQKNEHPTTSNGEKDTHPGSSPRQIVRPMAPGTTF